VVEQVAELFELEAGLRPAARREILAALLGSLQATHWARAVGCPAEPALTVPLNVETANSGRMCGPVRGFDMDRAIASAERRGFLLPASRCLCLAPLAPPSLSVWVCVCVERGQTERERERKKEIERESVCVCVGGGGSTVLLHTFMVDVGLWYSDVKSQLILLLSIANWCSRICKVFACFLMRGIVFKALSGGGTVTSNWT
jgi:hypothetical protein